MADVRMRTVGLTAAMGLLALLAAPPAVLANLPTGACCFSNGTCQDLMVTQCDEGSGDFIGEGTSCTAIDCAKPVGAPVLSIAGLVAVLGALAALGLHRLTIGRRGR